MNSKNIIPSAKQLRTVLIIMWSILGVYLIIKLLGGNWFEIACSNERFISICEYLDNNFVPRYLIATLSNFIILSLIYLSILRQWKFTKKQFIYFIIWVPFQSLIKTIYMSNTFISFSISFVSGFLFPILLYLIEHNKLTWKFILLNLLLTNILDFSFQLISLLVKNIGVKLVDEYLLVGLIFEIDVFIMETLYYLYINKFHQEKLQQEKGD